MIRSIWEQFKSQAVVPVLTLNEPVVSVGLVRALADGGLSAIEVTLRTERALECIAAIGESVDHAIVGVGTVLSAAHFEAAARAGARFFVSPGVTADLISAARDCASECSPWLPASATISEAMTLRDAGYRYQKFFPAEAAGGVSYLDACRAPVPDVSFCPTGGVNGANFGGYLALPNVFCVGGSWVAPTDLVAARDWETIAARARALRDSISHARPGA